MNCPRCGKDNGGGSYSEGEHKEHIVLVLKWGKGKVQVWCFDCREEFIGIKRCLRKIKEK